MWIDSLQFPWRKVVNYSSKIPIHNFTKHTRKRGFKDWLKTEVIIEYFDSAPKESLVSLTSWWDLWQSLNSPHLKSHFDNVMKFSRKGLFQTKSSSLGIVQVDSILFGCEYWVWVFQVLSIQKSLWCLVDSCWSRSINTDEWQTANLVQNIWAKKTQRKKKNLTLLFWILQCLTVFLVKEQMVSVVGSVVA